MREKDLICLRENLITIKNMGWVANQRPGNSGGIGNTLEDFLQIPENNLQLPDFGAWELKSQRTTSSSLLTLFHSEPNPRNLRVVPQFLLLNYGWPHKKAGVLFPDNEKSFRQTINTTGYSDRGFKVNIDYEYNCIYIDFNFKYIGDHHSEWRSFVECGIGRSALSPTPYWTFEEIEKKLKTKLNNLMYVCADTKLENGIEFFRYNEFEAFIDPTIERFLALLEQGSIYVDFDARTGHNHGTKFRIRPNSKTELYEQHIIV